MKSRRLIAAPHGLFRGESYLVLSSVTRKFGLNNTLWMSASGQKQTCAVQNAMSASHRKQTCAVQEPMSAKGQERTFPKRKSQAGRFLGRQTLHIGMVLQDSYGVYVGKVLECLLDASVYVFPPRKPSDLFALRFRFARDDGLFQGDLFSLGQLAQSSLLFLLGWA